jgi:hypothetical protein
MVDIHHKPIIRLEVCMNNFHDDSQLYHVNSDAQISGSATQNPNNNAEWVPHNFLDTVEEGNDEKSSNPF